MTSTEGQTSRSESSTAKTRSAVLPGRTGWRRRGRRRRVAHAMQILHESIPNSWFIAIPGAGHLPNIERSTDLTQTLERFLYSL